MNNPVWYALMALVFFALFVDDADATPLTAETEYEYIAMCELNDISYVFYTNDITLSGYSEGVKLHKPVMKNPITREVVELGKSIYLSRSLCFVLEN